MAPNTPAGGGRSSGKRNQERLISIFCNSMPVCALLTYMQFKSFLNSFQMETNHANKIKKDCSYSFFEVLFKSFLQPFWFHLYFLPDEHFFRGFDFETRRTTSLRDKEQKQDYRFEEILKIRNSIFLII